MWNDSSLWFWFVFLWWGVNLAICVSSPFLWRNVRSTPLPLLKYFFGVGDGPPQVPPLSYTLGPFDIFKSILKNFRFFVGHTPQISGLISCGDGQSIPATPETEVLLPWESQKYGYSFTLGNTSLCPYPAAFSLWCFYRDEILGVLVSYCCVTNYCKLSGLTQIYNIALLEIRCFQWVLRTVFLLDALGKNLFPPFSSFWRPPVFLGSGPSLHL